MCQYNPYDHDLPWDGVVFEYEPRLLCKQTGCGSTPHFLTTVRAHNWQLSFKKVDTITKRAI